ncbi:MAG TPA: hypothetical protein DCQ83_03390 [Fibrobacteres bacterium]|jgi:hypothetical protein|nr:hypothetical protein [Fibrobacterota bacterium]
MNLPIKLGGDSPKVFKFTEYFLKSRNKPGHVDQLTALEAIANAIHHELQVLDKETRHSLVGMVEKHPGKYIRVILLQDGETIHNAFFDRTARKKLR